MVRTLVEWMKQTLNGQDEAMDYVVRGWKSDGKVNFKPSMIQQRSTRGGSNQSQEGNLQFKDAAFMTEPNMEEKAVFSSKPCEEDSPIRVLKLPKDVTVADRDTQTDALRVEIITQTDATREEAGVQATCVVLEKQV